MGIQKEREAFEAWFEAWFESTKLHKFDDGVYWHERAQMSWEAWQTAKAQAVPEGFVLVKTSDIAKLAIAMSRVDLMTYSEARPDSEKLAWQNVGNKLEAMIEAQEQK